VTGGIAVDDERPFIERMSGAILLSDFAADPWYNMAADEMLLAEASRDRESVYLRLYTWLPGAITFGYNQIVERAVDLRRLGGTPLIRRVTGGRALFHDTSELTYAIAFNATGDLADVLGRSLSDTQSRLAHVLIEFLRSEGIDSEYSRAPDTRERRRAFVQSAPCFASTGRFELISRHRKVAASAQRRIQGAVLQHGALKIAGPPAHPALPLDPAIVLGDRPSPMAANSFRDHVDTFARAFSRVTGLPIRRRGYSEFELEMIHEWLDTVRKKSTERRDIFKHGPLHFSLS
jgi:lipoate-protein ligase A